MGLLNVIRRMALREKLPIREIGKLVRELRPQQVPAHLARLAVIEKSAGGPSLWAQLEKAPE